MKITRPLQKKRVNSRKVNHGITPFWIHQTWKLDVGSMTLMHEPKTTDVTSKSDPFGLVLVFRQVTVTSQRDALMQNEFNF